MTFDSQLSPPNDEQAMLLFALIGIEYLLKSDLLKPFEKNILRRNLLRYLERLGELYLEEPEKKI